LAHHAFELTAEDRALCVLPLTHSFGIRTAALAPFHAGATVVVAGRFDPAASFAWITEEAITWIPAVPTMFAAWAALGAPRRRGTLRWCVSAGAPLPDEVAQRAGERLGAPIYQGFGLTEATFSTVDTPPDPPTLGSVGRPSFGVEVEIHDEDGAPKPRGEAGEIVVRGPNVMAGYLNDPVATEAVTRDGWLRTGDVGRLDERGRLFVVDRIKDLILNGGNNVYPSEVENALAAHESVEAVAVIGVPDDYYGEAVVAIVVTRQGFANDTTALDRHARQRLARFKTPTAYAFVDSMPIGSSAKVLRRELRDRVTSGEIQPVSMRPREPVEK
jgi:long-chain acyl-CoA synthetase